MIPFNLLTEVSYHNNAKREIGKAVFICPGPESNRHPVFTGADFKSAASTYSATRALLKNSYLIWVKILLKAREKKQWGDIREL